MRKSETPTSLLTSASHPSGGEDGEVPLCPAETPRVGEVPQTAAASYAIGQLLRIAGWPEGLTSRAAAAIYYGSDASKGQRAAVWVQPNCAAGAALVECLLGSTAEATIRQANGVAVSAGQGSRLAGDVIAATASCLTLAGERRAVCRDPHGRLPADAGPLPPRERLERPPLHDYAELLAARLRGCGLLPEPLPRWPGGKHYAAALTHDVDAPEVPRRVGVLLKQMLLGGPRPRRHPYWDLLAEIRARGLGQGCLFPPTRRREWNFEEICVMEDRHGLRSAFYFAVVNRAAGHACDVSYDASRLRYRRLCRRLLSGGWEIGLHAAYATCEDRPPVEYQARRFAQLFGDRPAGVRHHYLRLDAEEPLRTLATNADAGFSYDTTVGFNDQPGFRMGVALPVEVFDPRRGGGGGLIELPMTLADMHLPKDDIPAAVEAVTRHLQTVRSLGGLAVLNWHVGAWATAPAWRESYAAACRILSEDSDVWVATPREIADWWRQRAAR